MTVIGNEFLKPLEELAKKQERIYPDACDVGILANYSLKTEIRRLCKGLREIYIGKTHRWHSGCSWSCFVPFEVTGETFAGVKVVVSLNRSVKKDFFSIDINHEQFVGDPFRKVEPISEQEKT